MKAISFLLRQSRAGMQPPAQTRPYRQPPMHSSKAPLSDPSVVLHWCSSVVSLALRGISSWRLCTCWRVPAFYLIQHGRALEPFPLAPGISSLVPARRRFEYFLMIPQMIGQPWSFCCLFFFCLCPSLGSFQCMSLSFCCLFREESMLVVVVTVPLMQSVTCVI